MKNIGKLFLLLTIGFIGCKDGTEEPDLSLLDPENCISCKKIETLTKAEADVYLTGKLKEIQDLSTSVPCSDETKWVTTKIGSKACGGPTGFIAYSKLIDTVSFKQKVTDYNLAQATYNKKFGIGSDCSVVLGPSKVICVDGKPKLIN